MAKLLVITDRLPSDPEWMGGVIWQTVLGLCESQHEVRVLTPQPLEQISLSHPRLTVCRPVTSWRAVEFPRMVQAIASFSPEIVHTFSLRPTRLWPTLTLWPYLNALFTMWPQIRRYATLFEAHDQTPKEASWKWLEESEELTLFSEQAVQSVRRFWSRPLRIVPWELEQGAPLAPAPIHSEVGTHLVPAAVSDWAEPQRGLSVLFEFMSRHPERRVRVVGGWGTWNSRARKEAWQWLHPVAHRLTMGEPLSFRDFIHDVRLAEALWLEPLPRHSWNLWLAQRVAQHWHRPVLDSRPWPEPMPVGSTANSLSRLFAGH